MLAAAALKLMAPEEPLASTLASPVLTAIARGPVNPESTVTTLSSHGDGVSTPTARALVPRVKAVKAVVAAAVTVSMLEKLAK